MSGDVSKTATVSSSNESGAEALATPAAGREEQRPDQLANATVLVKANVYFGGKVVSHTVLLAGNVKKTLGLIYPGSYHFETAEKERMDVVAGTCRVRLAGESDWRSYGPGTRFEIGAQSFFDIAVDEGITEYVCSFGG